MSQKKLKIVFYPYPALGVINQFIGIAQKLHNRGHRIIFAVYNEWKQKLINYGFEVITIINDNEEMSIDNYANGLFKSGFYDSSKSPLEKMKVFMSERMPLIAIQSHDSFKDVLNRVEPNIVITNHCIVMPLIKSEYTWIFAGTINRMLYLIDERTPPMFSGLPLYDNSQWFNYYEEMYNALEPLRDDISKLMSKDGLSPLPKNRLCYESPCLNIYNFPKELDYTHVSPLPSKWTQFAYMRTEHENFEIPENLINKTGKLIYLTMGSMLSVNVQMMKRFIEMLKDTPYRYIVSKGPFADRYELPENMCGDRMLPQTKVLPLVDLVIFHGGINTLIEAFYFGIPMIVMPFGCDGFDNAQRVLEEGLGLRMDPMNCTKEELINGIDYILNNNDLKKRFKEISQRIQSDDKSDRLVNAIESVAKQNN